MPHIVQLVICNVSWYRNLITVATAEDAVVDHKVEEEEHEAEVPKILHAEADVIAILMAIALTPENNVKHLLMVTSQAPPSTTCREEVHVDVPDVLGRALSIIVK